MEACFHNGIKNNKKIIATFSLTIVRILIFFYDNFVILSHSYAFIYYNSEFTSHIKIVRKKVIISKNKNLIVRYKL